MSCFTVYMFMFLLLVSDAEYKSVKRQDDSDSSTVHQTERCYTAAEAARLQCSTGTQVPITMVAMKPLAHDRHSRTSDSVQSSLRSQQSTISRHQPAVQQLVSRDRHLAPSPASHTGEDDKPDVMSPPSPATSSSHLMVYSFTSFVFSRNFSRKSTP